jgi:hypothetical protein
MIGYHPKHLFFKIACHKYGLVLVSKHENLTFFLCTLKTWKRNIFIKMLKMTQFVDWDSVSNHKNSGIFI